MSPRTIRVGQIVPSSNTTMETEVPAFLRAYATAHGGVDFTFHSARMRMKHVSQDQLAAMDRDSHRCARELADAPIDIAGYACLVAIMTMGQGYHRESESNLMHIAEEEGRSFPVVTSAGALIDELKLQGHAKVALVMPYSDALARTVASYIEAEGLTVTDYRNFSVVDNAEVGRIPGARLLGALEELAGTGADTIVLSACVQMPSMGVLSAARKRVDVPVTSTAECTSRAMIRRLGLPCSNDAMLVAA